MFKTNKTSRKFHKTPKILDLNFFPPIEHYLPSNIDRFFLLSKCPCFNFTDVLLFSICISSLKS